MRTGHGKYDIARTLARLEITAVPHAQHDVHERIVRMTVGDQVMGSFIRTNTDAAERKHSRGQGGRTQGQQKLGKVHTLAQVGGVLDQDVRHGRSLASGWLGAACTARDCLTS